MAYNLFKYLFLFIIYYVHVNGLLNMVYGVTN
jgi:hypothetical protein